MHKYNQKERLKLNELKVQLNKLKYFLAGPGGSRLISTLWEAKVGRSPEVRSSRPAW